MPYSTALLCNGINFSICKEGFNCVVATERNLDGTLVNCCDRMQLQLPDANPLITATNIIITSHNIREIIRDHSKRNC